MLATVNVKPHVLSVSSVHNPLCCIVRWLPVKGGGLIVTTAYILGDSTPQWHLLTSRMETDNCSGQSGCVKYTYLLKCDDIFLVMLIRGISIFVYMTPTNMDWQNQGLYSGALTLALQGLSGASSFIPIPVMFFFV